MFEPDVELDARLVFASFIGGRAAFFSAAMALGFESPDEALKRADWLKEKGKGGYKPENYALDEDFQYMSKVISRVNDLMKNKGL